MSQPAKTYNNLKEFWPFYLSEHSNRTNRNLHFVGTSMVFIWLGLAIAYLNPWYLLVALFNAYGFAWFGHFIIEKNRPATFKYPVKSFVSDFRMWFYTLTGQIGKQMQEHNIKDK
ncbi:MAG: DUF962 domain-containing protein [Leptospira sp.]|nr:DUF962 domain-containing protein [Leptospira sp.]